MRHQKEITALSQAFAGLTPPKYSLDWEQHVRRMRAVLRENLGGVGGTLEWQEYEQDFSLHVEEVVCVGGSRGLMRVELSLDPKKPLAEEISRLQDEIDAFQRAARKTIAEDDARREAAKLVRESQARSAP